MIIELAGIAGGLLVIVALGPALRFLARRMPQIHATPTETPRANPAWKLLRSDEELREAIDRAIACEQAAIAVLQRRAEHFAAMGTLVRMAANPTVTPTRDEGPPTRLTPLQPLRKAS